MFNNAGAKFGVFIKVIVVIYMVITGIAGIVGGIYLFSEEGAVGLLVILAAAVLIFVEWLSSLYIIGMCEMMGNVYAIKNMMEGKNTTAGYSTPTYTAGATPTYNTYGSNPYSSATNTATTTTYTAPQNGYTNYTQQ